jgi:DNA invertase Pin-like site-specific DNA recombinase
MNELPAQKVTSEHLKRRAFLYIRQSTPRQVIENTESTQRQYALRQRAVALGWPLDQITVIDTDLGQSGRFSADREGFQCLMTEVSMGRAGIIMGLEVSRLARNSVDWQRLLEICALTNSLILDEDGLYNPSDFNDRLLLGLKGTMSEAELHYIQARMRGGVLNKAKRGEFATMLPIGLVYDDQGRVVLDPDQQVRQTLQMLFETFRRVGSVFGVVRTFHQQGLLFPRRRLRGTSDHELFWRALQPGQAYRILRNPRYAGAYFFGRTKFRKRIQGKGYSQIRLPRDQWHTLILNAHAGYITWEEYEDNQRRVAANAQVRGMDRRVSTPAREGPALLQGLAICGVCGAHMQVTYHRRQDRLVQTYYCHGRSEGERTVRGSCQRMQGMTIDQAISDLLLETMTPVALEVALSVQHELQTRFEETDRIRRAQVERAHYEEQLARRRYLRVDPENRLVADSLEADWNEKLRILGEAQRQYEQQRQADQMVLGEQQRGQVLALATNFPKLWRDPNTPDRERKRMLRLLIEDVTLNRTADVAVHVRFKGGATKTLRLPDTPRIWEARRQPPDVVAEVDRLLNDCDYKEIAEILTQKGIQSVTGIPFTSTTLRGLCRRHNLNTRLERLRQRGLLTAPEIATKLGICVDTVEAWRKAGLLRGHVYDGRNTYVYEEPDSTLPSKRQGLKLLSRYRVNQISADCAHEA